MLKRMHCKICGEKTAHEVTGANHILHLLLTVITFGMWFPIWMLLMFTSNARCRECGSKPGSFILRVVTAVAVVIIGAMLLAYLNSPTK